MRHAGYITSGGILSHLDGNKAALIPIGIALCPLACLLGNLRLGGVLYLQDILDVGADGVLALLLNECHQLTDVFESVCIVCLLESRQERGGFIRSSLVVEIGFDIGLAQKQEVLWYAKLIASLLLVVPWKKVGTTEVQSCYYEIPIGTRENNLIVRNKHYKIGVNVGTLGSFAPSPNVPITPAYITVVDWSTGQTDVSISESRYLVVDENKVVMNNVNQYSIAYASSHDVTAAIESIQFYDLTGNTAQLKTFDADIVDDVVEPFVTVYNLLVILVVVPAVNSVLAGVISKYEYE